MKTQKFGVEVEMTGITRERAATIVADHFGAIATRTFGFYDEYKTTDTQGRTWKTMSDSSIRTEGGDDTELVTPICKYEDIETIQEIVRELKTAGAKVNSSCGIHVHINAAPHNAKTLKNLVNITAAKEDLIYKAIGVLGSRLNFCRRTETVFLENINKKKNITIKELEHLWYGNNYSTHTHYDGSRYHAVNLHSVFTKGTVEFRLFNSTLHAGKVKTYIQLCLAISHQALTQKCTTARRTTTTNDKYTMRGWLLRMGLIGNEYKTARKFLLENLTGNIAWRNIAG